MKVWFFYEEFRGSDGYIRKGYNAMLEMGGRMTCGTTLAESIFMAHDLIACFTEEERAREKFITDFMAEWNSLDVLNNGAIKFSYVGFMDIDVEIYGKHFVSRWGWVRKGDAKPSTNQPMRVENLRRAFKLTYKDFKLNR